MAVIISKRVVVPQIGPKIDPVFSNNDWEAIIYACENGLVPDTWVADGTCYKDMTINGTAYRIDIIGKNHDTYASGGTAPLTFQLHDCYSVTKPINAGNTTQGGWSECAMRTQHLSSLENILPTEIASKIKYVNKLTSAGKASSTILSSSDKLFLLSESELSGTAQYSFQGEGTQYQYYASGNTKVKEVIGQSNYNWWLRSPYKSDSGAFCNVYKQTDNTGRVSMFGASTSFGVSFAFCF